MHSEMKKIISILLTICVFNICVKAQETGEERFPRFTFGAEWGYVATVWEFTHNNFFSAEGYRINEKGNAFGYHSNGEVYLHAGYNFDEYWNLSLYAGYGGVNGMHKIVPISIRATRYYGNDPLTDRWFTFAGLGSGICLKRPVQEILAAKTGLGYRLSLSRDTKLDIHIAARATYTHMNIIYDGVPIDADRTNRNQFLIGALSLGMAVVF